MASKFPQAESRNQKHSPTAENPGRQVLKNCGECLWRDVKTGIIYAVIKRSFGKQIKQFKRSLGTTNVGVARQRLAEFRVGLMYSHAFAAHPIFPMPNAPDPAPKKAAPPSPLTGKCFMTLGEAWLATQHHLSPSTVERRRHSIEVISRSMGLKGIAKISRLDCERWAAKHSARVASRTFNMDIETLKLVCEYAILHGLISFSPAEHLKRKPVRNPEIKIPSRKEFVAILKEMRTKKANGKAPALDAADLVEAISYLGLRQGEANVLRWSDIDFDQHTVKVSGTKTDNARRTIPLFTPAEYLLRDMISRRGNAKPSDLVFLVKSAKTQLHTACELLGLPSFHHYTFRHYAATSWLEQGCSIKTVSKWLGHSPRDGGTTALRTYLHLRPEFETAEAARIKLDATDIDPQSETRVQE